MTKLTFFFVCAQVLIIQAVFSKSCGYSQPQVLNYGGGNSCGGGLGLGSNVGYNIGSNLGYNAGAVSTCGSNISYNTVPSNVVTSCGSNIGSVSNDLVGAGFGGSGSGQLAIVGEVPIGGNTYLNGNLPIIGLVEFNGNLPASGYVSVSGCTPCDCSQYSFNY